MSKIVYILGGPNGVGKTTQGNHFSGDKNIFFVNPDQIKIDLELQHRGEITRAQIYYVLDIYIDNALKQDDAVIIENNLHEESSFRFLSSYVSKHRAKSICRFYYLDDINKLIERVADRVKHLGHKVNEDTIKRRYKSSYQLIKTHINTFDEVHFFDTSSIIPVLVFEVFDGELNYINENVSFKWSDAIIDQLIDN